MDLAPNGGAVDADEERMRKRGEKVAQEPVHGLPERKGGRGSSMPVQLQQEEEEERRFISSLLTESEALENGVGPGDAEHNSFHPNDLPPEKKGQKMSREVELADIAKDLNKIKRQNTITHVLLGAVIVMTAVWQVNEMSFLRWVQRKLSNPFKSLGDLIKGSLKLKGKKPVVIESSPLPPVGIPDVTRADLPTLVISGDHR